MNASNELLRLDGVGIRFGGLQAVGDLSFTVDRGQVVGLIGPNGAGKTTAFNLITGVYKPTEGHITFEGRDITAQAPFRIAQAGIFRTFQTIRLFQGQSVLVNVLAGLHLRTKQSWWQGLLRTPAQRREEIELRDTAMALLQRLELDAVAHEDVASLSYGVQRRVELARALIAGPKLLILDEPAAGLNDQESAALNRTILSVRDQGISVLLVEHDMNVVMNVTDHIVCINFGRKIAEGNPDYIRNHPQVIEAYLGRDDDENEAADTAGERA
ncbi:lipopolysaccharide export system ATP-binding protein LptB [mine drainage metagenome]|uniref:Lipopolysaccharide export system ATP-binding protein LptB n=1 Tax=mine drainage metagenome TaxID=410659 RepID=A0A1J5QBS7_9ZZZZ